MYLIQLPDNLRVVLIKFRCRYNKMPVEIGVRDNVPREQRICNLCDTRDIGDEFHYLFICKHLQCSLFDKAYSLLAKCLTLLGPLEPFQNN